MPIYRSIYRVLPDHPGYTLPGMTDDAGRGYGGGYGHAGTGTIGPWGSNKGHSPTMITDPTMSADR